MTIECPKCGADISHTFAPSDYSVGIMNGGWHCEACDEYVDEHSYREEWEADHIIDRGQTQLLMVKVTV